MGGGCRTCQELEALWAALFGCWMAAGWRKSEAAGRWRVANQGGEEARGIRFSADSQMVLAAAVRAVPEPVLEHAGSLLRGDGNARVRQLHVLFCPNPSINACRWHSSNAF